MPLTKEAAKNLSILSVAEQLGMELKRTGNYSYTWTEHDSFVIDARKNDFHWNSRSEFGDVIQLVQTIRGVTYKEAMHFLETGEFKKVDLAVQIAPKEPFYYNLEKYEHQDFKASRSYLKTQRGLSDDTINFFLSQGSMAEATQKKGDYFEPVIVFKYKDNTGFLAGASLQGIVENRVHYPERGRLKQIMRNSDGQLGFSIDIGIPKRLVFAEAPIDLMSYYELHKDRLQDVRLVAMDGIKDGIISRRFMELYAEMNGKSYQVDQNAGKALETVARTTNFFKDGQNQDMITLAVDNDAAGQNFITRLQEKGIPVQIAIPPIVQLNQEKEDWNDFLKRRNEAPKELAHVYTADEKSWHYQGFFEKEIALAKAQELTADDVKAFVSDWQLTREEVRQEYTRIVDQEKERKHTMSEVHEAGAEYEVEKPDNSRLAQARRKLERLRGEQDEAISRAYSHQTLTNGQPMNDKRGGSSFMRKQEQIEGQVFSKMDEIRQQEERVERLEHQQHLKEMGLNRQGSGLEMSVQNIPRIREELEKAERGESFFTKATLKRYQEELTRLEAISEQMGKTSIQPATQALIDEGLVNQWQKQPNTYFVKGLRRVALELTEEGEFQLSSQTKYHPKTDEERLKVDELLAKQGQENAGVKQMIEEEQSSAEENIQLGSVESEEKEKSLESIQETANNSEQNKKAETKLGDFPEGSQVAAPLPEANISQPLNDLSPSQTRSQPLLHFSINEDRKSIYKDNYHPISDKDLLKLNRYAPHLQNAAQWYLSNVADSQVTYFYQDGADTNSLAISYNKESFIHLTGIYPYREGQTAGQTLLDFAAGNGQFDNILIANRGAAFDKLKVLPELPAIVDSESFYFGDLSDVEKFHSLNLDKAIRSNDQDVLLAFRTVDGTVLPASLMRLRKSLNLLLDQTNQEKIILGVFRERDGHIEQLSINEEYVKDKGAEMLSVLKNKQFEEVSKEIEQTTLENTLNKTSLDSAMFTQVLDTVYNLGVPGDISKTPEEFHQAWNQYLDYAKQYNDKFDKIVAAAGEDHLLDTNSDFYKEWKQDQVYKENYHVRLQWSEERLDGPQLPFKETELISYQDFTRELYKANQSFYLLHQEGLKQVTDGRPEGYISPTKIQFSIYAPNGELIQDSIRYNIGEEINPIAHKERLGTREMREHSELMKIDGTLFNQYHLERLASEQTIENIREEFEKTQVKNSQNTPDNPYEKIYQYNRKDERDRDLDGDGISNSDEMLQGTDPYNAASNLHKKQEDRERRTDAEVAAGAIITEAVATKKSEQTISQLVSNKDTKALAEHLKEGMKNYLDSEQFRSFLDTMSKFHNYSLNNIHLLKMQNPNVSQVASFNKWKTDFERTVKKGSKALKIWVPYQVKTKISANQNELSFSPSENEMEDKEVTVTRFKLGNVFDVSQTEGKELPKAINELTGSVKDYEDLYRAAKAVSMDNQVPISFEDIKKESANGYYSPDENRIVISKGLKGQEHILKTIFHEMAHSDLHRGTNAQYGDDQYRKQELQAESVAYVVANHFGFDTSSYSFGYLAIWAKDKNGFEDMVEQLQVVQKEAKSLIDRMDAKLELVKNKSVTKDKFADKLQQAKEKSEQLGNQKAEAVKQVEEKKSLSSPH
ncbi:PBECR4 domain-containing protein [Streptococcus infantis]|uniref:PBECR4 domain-containing protein n=1 Tax=Streptococcus infantis TaxID=68892 RepID=UPI0039C3C073